jgi:hypothetical protein
MMASQNTAEPLLTPSVIIPFHLGTSGVYSGANGYFSSCSGRATLPQVASSSAGVSALRLLQPGKLHSADSYDCLDGCSHHGLEDNTYLTPPLSRGDYGVPPYRSRSESSGSLNTAEHNADILSQGKPMRGPRKHCTRSGNSHPPKTDNVKEGHLLCSAQGTKTISDAPMDPSHRNLCSTKALAISTQLNVNSREGHLIRKISTPAPLIVSRRWSSVGIDYLHHPTCLRRTEPTERRQSHKRDRSRTWTLGLQEAEFIQVVRSRLTSRRVSVKRVDTPATITLRRASGTARRRVDGISTPVPLRNVEVEQPPAYLITSGDVDSVLGLIQSTFQKSFHKKSSSIISDLRTEHSQLESNGRRLSVTTGGVFLPPSVPADPATTVTGVMRTSKAAHMSLVELESLGLESGESRSALGTLPRKSIYEVIWEGNSPPQSSTCTSRAPLTNSAIPETSGESTSMPSLDITANPNAQEISACLKESSNQVRNYEEVSSSWPIFRSVWNVPASKDTSGEASSTSQSSTVSIAEAETSITGYNPLKSNLPDVISFPPLPSRKFTSDWISPLPDITTRVFPMLQITEPPLQPDGGSLYDSGIDARTGQLHSGITTPNKGAHSPELTSSNPSSPHIQYQSSDPKPPGKKSLALPQQETAPRTGHVFTLGHAIGVSSGVRRKSSTQSKHIHIAHSLPDCHHGSEPWIKPRKDSGWPTRESPSPEELNTRGSSQNAPLIPKRSVIDIRQTDVGMNWD